MAHYAMIGGEKKHQLWMYTYKQILPSDLSIYKGSFPMKPTKLASLKYRYKYIS